MDSHSNVQSSADIIANEMNLFNSGVQRAERRAGELDVREPSARRQQARQHDSVAVRILSISL